MNSAAQASESSNFPPKLTELINIWVASGHSLEELHHVLLNPVQCAFLSAVRPKPEQIAEWKATGVRYQGLSRHIIDKTGIVVTSENLECLWRYFTGEKQKRHSKTISDFLHSSPEQQVCSHCGASDGLFHVDHVVPIARGGSDAAKNLQVLCRRCNHKKGSRYDSRIPFVQLYQ